MSNSIKYLKLKRGIYYYQRRVPRSLLSAEPFRNKPATVEISTGTRDQNAALIRLTELNQQFERDIEIASGNVCLHNFPTMKDTSQVTSLLSELDADTIQYLARVHFSQLMRIVTDSSSVRLKRDVKSSRHLTSRIAHELADVNARGVEYEKRFDEDFDAPVSLKRIAIRLLRDEGVIPHRSSEMKSHYGRWQEDSQLAVRLSSYEQFLNLMDELIEVELEILAMVQTLAGRPISTISTSNSKFDQSISDLRGQTRFGIESVVEELIRSSDTTLEWQAKLRRVPEILSDFGVPLDIRKIRKEHLNQVRDSLLRCPINKSQLFPESSYPKAIQANEIRKAPCLSPNTVRNGYLAPIKRIFAFASDRELIGKNPATKVSVKGARRYGRGTHFEDYELRRLFSHPLFTEGKTAGGKIVNGGEPQEAHWVWGPVVALYTGARTSEIAALRVEDVRLDAEIPYINIEQTSERGLKTDASSRMVPIHQTLIDLGLEQLLDRAQAAGERGLFPGWVAPPRKKLGDSPSQRHFRRQLVSFASDRQSPRPNFHSFRNTMKSGLLDAGVSVAHQNAILGHEQEPMTQVYGTGLKFQPIQVAINKFEFSCPELFAAKLH